MSTSILFVRVLVEALEHFGVSRERFFLAAPIDPDQLDRPDARLELEELDALLDLALTLSGDDAFGLRMGEMANTSNYNLAAHLVAHASTLREGIDSLLRFHQLLTDRPCFQLVEDGRTATVLYDAGLGSSRARRFRTELTVIGFYRMVKHFDRNARPLVAFDYPAPAYRAEYARVFEGAARFGQTFTGVAFDRDRLVSAQIHGDPELHAALVARAEKRVSQRADSAPYAERVRRYILDRAAPNRRDMEAVARALGLSARSLRRRLREEGVAFRDVVDGALGILAKRLIADNERPIEAAAYEMGFSHPSAFHRAFKRWTGDTPAASRPAGPQRRFAIAHPRQSGVTARCNGPASPSRRDPR
jgi:AraC-like DNA-binding protein